ELVSAECGRTLYCLNIAFERRVFLLVMHHQEVRFDVDRVLGALRQTAEAVGDGLRFKRCHSEKRDKRRRSRSGAEERVKSATPAHWEAAGNGGTTTASGAAPVVSGVAPPVALLSSG